MNPQYESNQYPLRAISGENPEQLFNDLRSQALKKGWEEAQKGFVISRRGTPVSSGGWQMDPERMQEDYKLMKTALHDMVKRKIETRVDAVNIQEMAKETLRVINYR